MLAAGTTGCRHRTDARLPGATAGDERKLEAERSRIARDLHDDLGATLTEINFLGTLGAANAQSAASRDLLEGIVERAQRMAKSLDEIVWTVNPDNDTLSSTVNYLCSRTQESLRTAGVRCRLDVAGDLPSLTLDSELRHHLLMAINEAVNNVMKHAAANEVHLAIRRRDAAPELEVSDEGCGFDPATVAADRNGLRNLRTRIASMGGVCTVRSSSRSATTAPRPPRTAACPAASAKSCKRSPGDSPTRK